MSSHLWSSAQCSVVGLMANSSNSAYVTCCMAQVCCRQSPCPHDRPLLTCASVGDTKTPKGRSFSLSVGPLGLGTHKVFLSPPSISGKRGVCPCYQLVEASPLPLKVGYSFWWDPTFSCQIDRNEERVCSAMSCTFGVLAGEDECTSLYSTIMFSDYIIFSWRFRSSIQSAKTRLGAAFGSDHEVLIAKFRLKLKKVGKLLDHSSTT